MSDEIRIELDGDRQAGLRFEEFPDDLREALQEEISALTSELLAREQAAAPARTGKLRSQIHDAVHNDPKRIKGTVYFDGKGSGSGSDFAKAGALEYGSTGKKFKVAAHPMALDHIFERHLLAPITVLSKAHERSSSIAEHRFARGALASMQPEIISRLNAVVTKTVDEANQ